MDHDECHLCVIMMIVITAMMRDVYSGQCAIARTD